MNKLVFKFILIGLLFLPAAGGFGQSKKADAEPFFEPEKSGSNITLTAASFNGERLRDGDLYLPDMIRGYLIEYLGKFSQITLKDYHNNDSVEISSKNETHEDETIEADEIAEADETTGADEEIWTPSVYRFNYTLTGSIVSISNREFSLSFNITDSGKGNVIASHNAPLVNITQIRNGSAMREAAGKLLGHMNVVLTPAGVLALEADGQNAADAHAKLAKSKIALGTGNNVEGFINAYGAVDRYPALPGAEEQLQKTIRAISSADTGLEIQSDYQQWQAWDKQLRDFEKYFRDHPPFEMFYTQPVKSGEINYSTATVDLEFLIGMQPSIELPIMQKVLRQLNLDLNKTKNRGKWNFNDWPLKFLEYDLNLVRKFTVTYGLYNGENREIHRNTVDLQTQLIVKNNKVTFDSTQRMPVLMKAVRVSDLGDDYHLKLLTINNGLVSMELNDAQDDGYWVVQNIESEKFPKGKTPTIAKGSRKIVIGSSTAAAVALPSHLVPDPPLLDMRYGVSFGSFLLLNKDHLKDAIGHTSLGVGFDFGYRYLTVEALIHFPVTVFSKNIDDLSFISLGAGIGATGVTQYVLPTLTFGTSVVVTGDGSLFVPYCQAKFDFIPSGNKGFALRLGLLLEAGWSEKHKNYFTYQWTKSEKFFLNGNVFIGFSVWI